jgi:tRNA-splicing ligase RtcB
MPVSQHLSLKANGDTAEVINFASIVDDKCIEQAMALSRSPIVRGHVALMPDTHFGFGPPVGSVFKMANAVMPYAVGVDIGCGMIAVETPLNREDISDLDAALILEAMKNRIPAGKGLGHETPTLRSDQFFNNYGYPPGLEPDSRLPGRGGLLVQRRRDHVNRARQQFGTLGAGNHFVEVCVDGVDKVWLLLHSGSRGIGNMLATAHQKVAKEWCDANRIELEDRDFAYLMEGTGAFDAYIRDMLWAQNYAYFQRESMMFELIDIVRSLTGINFPVVNSVNCHHNYAERVGDGTWLVRKGAIDASLGTLGIIPASMGGYTYIVEGLGDDLSYDSAPHGAGRMGARGKPAHGEKEATGMFASLSVEAFRSQMRGVTWQEDSAEKLLDEAPNAYKPIAQVIADSAALVAPFARLTQFINYKGV